MQSFPDDNPNLPVRLLLVERADAGALENADAIAITVAVEGRGEHIVFGLRLDDQSTCVVTLGPVPAAATKVAKAVSETWAVGGLTIPLDLRNVKPN